jgi:RNA polymerase sigma-70 factor (ECF subfamily)
VSEAAATATTVTATPATGPPAPGAARHAADAHGDAALVAASRHGDREAFEELVRRTARLAYARAYLETGDRHRAEDLVQETFLTAWRKLDQLTDAAGFRPWLMTILHSVLIDSVRRASRKKRKRGGGSGDAGESDVLRLADPSPTPAVAAQTNEERQRALSILRSLPREYQQVLMLRYLAGADYDTIARQLALTNGSLRGLLHRGLAMLRKEFERE